RDTAVAPLRRPVGPVAAGEYIGMSLDPQLARAAAAGVTHLTPEP
ncbi:hypothetical protein MGSAQ_002424, partial [marine sediment metagenome]